MVDRIRQIPGAADVHVQQALNEPMVIVDVDRTKAQEMGFTQANVASDALVGLVYQFPDRSQLLVEPPRRKLLRGRRRRRNTAWTPSATCGTFRSATTCPQPEILANLATIRRRSDSRPW